MIVAPMPPDEASPSYRSPEQVIGVPVSGRNRKPTKNIFGNRDHPIPESLLQPVTKTAPKPVPVIRAQSETQKVYLRKLSKRHHDILLVTGPAGTGKTYLAVVQAIKELRAGTIKKIIITRPNVGAGDDLGHLPGTLIEKMAPWMQPVLDVFKEFYEVHEVERMIQNEIIEIAPLVFMRGRTLKGAFVIADEMQNATIEQMKMFLTRIGEGSIMVITGDMEQHDRGEGISGLADFIERLKARDGLDMFLSGSDADDYEDESFTSDYNVGPEDRSMIGYVAFSKKDVVRHRVIEQVLNLYA